MNLRKPILCTALSLGSFSIGAINPLWVRDAAISPDGQWIAFTYRGDIYKVPTAGGDATRLTTQPSYDERPVWSPDGKRLAFASDRNGSADLFIMDADGGAAKRLTYYSGSEYPTTFSPDGKSVLFNAAIQDAPASALFPKLALTELYSVPTAGGKISQILSTPAETVTYLPDGTRFLYQDVKGVESEWRKHHTSSVTRDIWMYDSKSGQHTNLTAHPGEDRNPVIANDGKTIYILSERNGASMNVYSFPLDNPAKLSQVTNFKTHPVRFLSAADNGTLAFTYNGELYSQIPGKKPTKVAIDLCLDEESPVKRMKVSTSNGATASPDGKQVAFSYRGNIFVTSTEYATTKQITSTPAAESDINWKPDGRTIAYTSERDGHYNIYLASIARDDEPNFANSTIIDEKPLFNDGHDRQLPTFSPDGKKLAFVQDRQKLMVIDLESKKVTQLTDGTTNPERDGQFSFTWSPDNRWIAFELTGNGHEPYADIAVVNVEGTPKVTNLTRSAYFDMNPKWALDGNAIIFESDRYGMRSHASWGSQSDVMAVFLNQDAYDRFRLSKEDYELLKDLEKRQKADKAKAEKKGNDKKDDKKEQKTDSTGSKNIDIQLAGVQDRIVRLTPHSGSIRDFIVTSDGETLYYLLSGGAKDDLWKLDMRKREPSIAAKIGANGRHLQLADAGKELFILGTNGLTKMSVKSEKTTPITYSATMILDPAAEREYMFQHVKREVENRFYEKSLHGVDWKAMTANYARFLPHIDNNYDFAEMLSELLGELNVSHTGGRFYPTNTGERTASLGLLYDWNYNGEGLRVAQIVEGGPFDHANTLLQRGSIIKSINRNPITPDTDYNTLLADIAAKKTLVEFTQPDGQTIEEVVLPITTGAMNKLLYKRWVQQRAADVDSLSGGRLGYVHLPQMDDEAFRGIYIDLLGKYVDKEGVVIDTRFNGGGRLHEDIEVLFSGEKYLTQVIRGQDVCDMPSRRWNKPSIMLQCESNYSNAHGTPWVYRYKKLGKLVGAPVPGTMTSVNWETLQDPTLVYGIPVIGYRTAEGNYLENTQLEPDVLVLNDPAKIVKGEDQQLKVAVETLLNQIDKK